MDVQNGYYNNDLPLDTIWADLEHMLNRTNFVMDTNVYKPEELN